MLLPLVTASRANIFLTNLPWLHHEHGFLHVESVKSKLGLNCVLEEISMQNMLAQLYDKRTKRKSGQTHQNSRKGIQVPCLSLKLTLESLI